MKHEFKDELRITVDHEHEIPLEEAGELVDKIVEGVVIIIGVATVAHILKGWLA